MLQDSQLQEANLPLPIQLMPLPCLSFLFGFLQPSHPGCFFLLLFHPLQATGTAKCAARCWIQSALHPDQFLVLTGGIAMQTVVPTKKQEVAQSGSK